MPRPKNRFKEDFKRKVYIRYFHELSDNKKHAIQADICTFAEALFYDPDTKKRPRSPSNGDSFLKDCWVKKYNELKEKQDQASKQQIIKQYEKKMIYWLFDQFLDHIQRRVEIGKRSENTLRQYQYAINYYKSAHNNHPIERRFFNDSEIDKLITVMVKSGCNDRTIWKHMVAIKGILSWGYRQYDENDRRLVLEQIDFNLPRKPKSTPVLYTTEEVIAIENQLLHEYSERLSLLQEAKERGYQTRKMANDLFGVYLLYKAFTLIKNTGMRIGEVLFLPYHHIDLNRKEILIADVQYRAMKRKSGDAIQTWKPKGNKSRRIINISMNQSLLDFLVYDSENKQENETMFLGNGTGYLYFSDTTNITRAARKVMEKSNAMPDKVKPFHSLRGWAITYLLSLGIPIPEVQNMVGHEEVTTTIGYFNMMKNSSGASIGALSIPNESRMFGARFLEFNKYHSIINE